MAKLRLGLRPTAVFPRLRELRDRSAPTRTARPCRFSDPTPYDGLFSRWLVVGELAYDRAMDRFLKVSLACGAIACSSSSSPSSTADASVESPITLSADRAIIGSSLHADQATEKKAAPGHHFWAIQAGFWNRTQVVQPVSLSYFTVETTPPSTAPLAPLANEGSCGKDNGSAVQPGSLMGCTVILDITDDHPPTRLLFMDGKTTSLSAAIPAGAPGTL